MQQSVLFGKTRKEAPKDDVSTNTRLLTRAGFVDKLMAGVYTYLPLGLRVLRRIQEIVREEMDAIGGQEMLMPALHPKELWATTGRWTDPGPEVMFQFKGRSDKEFGLGWTHEEIITPLAKKFITSYKDLPLALYQIQDKFRNEPRAKSGLLRGIEFSMKDLYSFHRDEEDLGLFYAKALDAYAKIFQRCGLDAILTEASGGSFSKYSHEFQVLTPYGEDTLFVCSNCHYAQNKDIFEGKPGDRCPKCSAGTFQEQKGIEVGNIFQLKTKYSDAFHLTYADEKGNQQPVLMGCYGIGPSRVMGAIVEVHHDERGVQWPASVAPFAVHLLQIGDTTEVAEQARIMYEAFQKAGIEVLFDDRTDMTAGQKFADADLIGIPWRAVVSAKTAEKVELKGRDQKELAVLPLGDVLQRIRSTGE